MVEGRYDKIKLSGLVDAVIVTTEGFGIFRNKQRAALLRRYAESCGILILTDSDRAGFIIRNYVANICQNGTVLHAYIPDVPGKERRKAVGSKAGTLGVEGIADDVLLHALLSCTGAAPKREGRSIEKRDLYALGLSGKADSAARRAALLAKLELPGGLSANGLLDVLNATASYEQLCALCRQLDLSGD